MAAPGGWRDGLLADAGLRLVPGRGLMMGSTALADIAAAVGTPTYVYHADAIRARYGSLASALGVGHPTPQICYAVKANSTLAVLRVLKDLGAGADIVSGGELRRVIEAGFDPARVVFSGVGKTVGELDAAALAGVGQVNLESLEEIDAVAGAAARTGRPVRVGLRINPDVTTETHPYISTGRRGIKFGIPVDQVAAAAERIAAAPGLVLVAVGMHVGSQLLDTGPHIEGLPRLVSVVRHLRDLGVTTLEHLGVGGGFGIRYRDESAIALAPLAEALVEAHRATDLHIQLEPGRYLVGSAGVLLVSVLYRKHSGGKDFVIVDGGMNDLVRPSHYQAYHDIVEVVPQGRPSTTVDVVGPVCETGDFLALDRSLPALAPGEVLALLGAGAYGFVMGSNYNSRPRPAEVLVDDGRALLARARESQEDLFRGEAVIPAPIDL